MGTAANKAWGAPLPFGMTGTAGANTTQALSATSAKAAGVFACDCDAQTIVITHAWFKQSAQTLTPGVASYMISLQTLDASGLPSGNDVATGSAVSAGTGTATSFQPVSGDTNVGRWIALGNSYTHTRGDQICVVVEHIVVDASNFITVAHNHTEFSRPGGMSYSLGHNGTSWTKSSAGQVVLFAVKNTDASIVIGCPAKTLRASNSFGATVEVGGTWTRPTNECATYTVKAIRWKGRTPSTGAGTYQVRIYTTPTGTPSAAQSATAVDNDIVSAANSDDRGFTLAFNDASLVTLNSGTKYGFGISTTTGSDSNFEYIEVGAAADFNAFPHQQQIAYAARTNASYPPAASSVSFTETLTQRGVFELVFGDETAPSGGGGGSLIIAPQSNVYLQAA